MEPNKRHCIQQKKVIHTKVSEWLNIHNKVLQNVQKFLGFNMLESAMGERK